MRRLKVFAAIAVALILLSGCATVKIYSDAGLKNETGLRFYTLRPYLLVEYMAEKANTVKTTVVYLPDLSSPQYASVRSGIGSGDLKMTFTNSALATYGVSIDSKIPESMEAFAAMLSRSAYAAQAFDSAPPRPAPEEEDLRPDPGASFRLFEIITGPSGSVLKEVVLSDNRSDGQ